MKKAILAKKVGMMQVFSEDGKFIPVTVVKAGPCVVVQKKTTEDNGYNAIKVGYMDVKLKHITKPVKGQFDKAEIAPKKYLREFKISDISSYEVGTEIKADIFAKGDKVDVSGVSKGKGYQGSIKRHGHGRGPMSHGSKYHRGSGAMQAATSPGGVKKGKKLPGHMGNIRVTVSNLEVVRSDAEKGIILIKGAVPGPKGALLMIKDTVKVK